MTETQPLLSEPTQNYHSTLVEDQQPETNVDSTSNSTKTISNSSSAQDLNKSLASSSKPAGNLIRVPAAVHPWLSYFEDLLEEYSASRYLENTNSVARDHLANERTYLAWLRTSLATISCGVAITQFFRMDKSVRSGSLLWFGRPVGLCFILMGMMFLMFAFVRYFHVQGAMTKGYFPASRGIVIMTTSSVLVALIALLIIVIFAT
ncbi:hypothetical protein CLU79DRAFT_841961 [Phycomyces nitens]|nr:hypothetical protein CLU79DRAFT_841961 [Phycomyces nitens]